MSVQEVLHHRPGFDFRPGNLFARVAAWRRRRAVYVAVYEELAELGDRELADLNLSRADIRRIASESAAQTA